LREGTTLDRLGQLHDLIAMWKMEHMGVGRIDQLIGRSEANIKVKRHLPQPGSQLSKYDELLLHVWVTLRLDGIKQADQIRFLIRETDAAITQVKSFGDRDYCCRRQISFSLSDTACGHRLSTTEN
jgi:hypothetical protein